MAVEWPEHGLTPWDDALKAYVDAQPAEQAADTESPLVVNLNSSFVGFGSDLDAFVAGLPAGALWRYDLQSATTGELLEIYSGKKD